MSALAGIKQMYPKNPIACEIKKTLLHFRNAERSVKFLWVPSHTGIAGNEEADEAAARAVTDSNSSHKFNHSDVKLLIKDHIIHRWQEKWNFSTSNFHEIMPQVTTTLNLPSHRKNQVVISRMRFGHSLLTHQHLFSNEEPPICPACNTSLTVKHILLECPRYETARRANHLQQSIQESMTSNVDSVLQFLKDTNLYYCI
ncbi:unnamed protein product [Acanthoscelides obtectus]|uniref:RNase H type-1 domain-containing protein n=1 Tax=Acanthoscelides obtectus TaxID=200917 RepID=A0A9P0PWC8_ACAOB|nr:unnamed protein product [Acanthoscelides obtectus]CAK1624015.1 hypothetical protein AOBTE_LOCUS2282 [Acanthoscelides obtectus]